MDKDVYDMDKNVTALKGMTLKQYSRADDVVPIMKSTK
jgi:hypothetical protein